MIVHFPELQDWANGEHSILRDFSDFEEVVLNCRWSNYQSVDSFRLQTKSGKSNTTELNDAEIENEKMMVSV